MGLITKSAFKVLPISFILKLCAAGSAFISILFFFAPFVTLIGSASGIDMAFGFNVKQVFMIFIALVFALGTVGTLVGLTIYRFKHLLKADKTILLVGTIIAFALSLIASLICFTANSHIPYSHLGFGAVMSGIFLLGSAACLGFSLFLTLKK